MAEDTEKLVGGHALLITNFRVIDHETAEITVLLPRPLDYISLNFLVPESPYQEADEEC